MFTSDRIIYYVVANVNEHILIILMFQIFIVNEMKLSTFSIDI